MPSARRGTTRCRHEPAGTRHEHLVPCRALSGFDLNADPFGERLPSAWVTQIHQPVNAGFQPVLRIESETHSKGPLGNQQLALLADELIVRELLQCGLREQNVN